MKTAHKHPLFGDVLGGVMQENRKKWLELCEQAADEQDPKKLAALILEINYLLEVKEYRLRNEARSTKLSAKTERIVKTEVA
jgi:hypothetical protein